MVQDCHWVLIGHFEAFSRFIQRVWTVLFASLTVNVESLFIRFFILLFYCWTLFENCPYYIFYSLWRKTVW